MFAPITLAFFLMQAPAEQKLATLEGVVTHAATQTPIRKAKVGLSAIGFEGGGTVETGDDGKFSFKDVNTKTAGPIGNATHPRTLVMSADGKFEFKHVVPAATSSIHCRPGSATPRTW